MSQQVGIAIGIPVMSAIVAVRLDQLGRPSSDHVLSAAAIALAANAALCLLASALVGRGLRGAA
jgi:hypothetical protein